MNTILDFQKEDYNKLIESLKLEEDMEDKTDNTDYFNAWNFGLSEEDFEFVLSASL